jgi:hypothetical protein
MVQERVALRMGTLVLAAATVALGFWAAGEQSRFRKRFDNWAIPGAQATDERCATMIDVEMAETQLKTTLLHSQQVERDAAAILDSAPVSAPMPTETMARGETALINLRTDQSAIDDSLRQADQLLSARQPTLNACSGGAAATDAAR